MRWERFFEDLEGQLDSEWEAERAALDTEAERLRLSRIPLRERLVALTSTRATLTVQTPDGSSLTGAVCRVGADWIALVSDSTRTTLVPLGAISEIALVGERVLASARDAHAGDALASRMGFGFVLRDLVRRRIAVVVCVEGGRALSGTIDRAGADHLDLALHDPGVPRRAENVTGYRLVPFTAVMAVRLDDAAELA